MTLKEQIKQLEEIANQEDYSNYPEVNIAKQALVIIKKQEKALEIAIKELRSAKHYLNSYNARDEVKWCNAGINAINKLLEENDNDK